MKFTTMKKMLAGVALSLSITGFAIPAHASENSNVYVAKDDDTFWTISRKLHINLNDFLLANPHIDPLNVYKGLSLKLPQKNTVKAMSMSTETQNYSKVINGVATAYSDAPGENGGWGAVDYFGNPLQLGTIAVDPKVIPLGTKVHITGYSYKGLPKSLYATAADMGGAVKNNHIDIFIPSSLGKAKDFGMQNVQIYILK